VKPFNLKERAKHWSFQPVRQVAPPDVKNGAWSTNALDRFVLAKLEMNGLSPPGAADKRTWLRRVTFDLIGLPPTPAEVEAFLADDSPAAHDAVVERLLASPHYGERWGRHWLDLVRFAETAGHEFDYEIRNAYRYRDYVIRAFNADVPYDQFVLEHLAGDLLQNPRRHPVEGFNESILGTGFFLLGEGVHSPVDVRDDAMLRTDNQIDVLSKTFLGLTVACARCHDHKFDAISTRDYYALAGFLMSSRHQQAFIDAPERIAPKAAEVGSVLSSIRSLLAAAPEPRAHFKGRVAAQLLPAPSNPLHEGDILFEDFTRPGYDGWFVSGDAFGAGPTRAAEVVPRGTDAETGLVMVPPGVAHSGLVANRLQGVLRSKTFPITKNLIHVLATGPTGRLNVVVDGFEKIRAPIYGGLTVAVNSPERWRWVSIDVSMWREHSAYLEIGDGATVSFESGQTTLTDGDGFVAVDEIWFSDSGPPAEARVPAVGEFLDDPAWYTPEACAKDDAARVTEIAERWRSRLPAPAADDGGRLAVLNWFASARPIRPDDPDLGEARARALRENLARYRALAASIPQPTFGLAVTDGTGSDQRVHVRGSYRTLGDVAPRRFLEAVSGAEALAPSNGSGRLELARTFIDPANPFVARVLVNRLWKHHFGQGIVPTPDDFGAMGQSPSHPELLDYLASELIRNGWSIKAMHRQMVLSSTYRMSSRPDPNAERADPNNVLLHRMKVRRLEAEAIRDSILAVSGQLNNQLYGPSVLPYLTPFMEGRGRPARTGPLGGDGRRSLYIDVRRNFLTPMLLSFDYPAPFSTMGRRNVSNVPAQALTLMNDPFVLEQCRRWAERVRARPGSAPGDSVRALYAEAFSRPPSESELADALTFLRAQGAAYGAAEPPRPWVDLCHVLVNVKEFVFVD
jgi:hypothetical protein